MFISIFIATCRPENIVPFFNNLAKTAHDHDSFELLIKLDQGADELIAIIDDYKKSSTFSIKYLVTPKLEGYYSLDLGYNELLKITHPDTYFCWLLTDEIRIETKGWDNILKNYIRFYPDDIFRIKLSIFQLKNYTHLYECLPCPDNYAVTTRRWLEITGGWGQFWGPDSWHQCIDFYLSLCKNEYYPYGIWRSFPVFDIKIRGQEAGVGVTQSDKLKERTIRIWYGWHRHSTYQAQENYYRLAQRLNAHIYAYQKNIQQYILSEDLKNKTIYLYDMDGKRYQQQWRYKLPKLKLKVFVGYKIATIWDLFPFLYDMRRRLVDCIHWFKKLEWYYMNRAKNRMRKKIDLFCFYLVNGSIKITPLFLLNYLKKIKPRTRLKKLAKCIAFKLKGDVVTQDFLFDGKYLKPIHLHNKHDTR